MGQEKQLVNEKLSVLNDLLQHFVSLTNFDDDNSIKRTNNYLNWSINKTKIICNEDEIIIPRSFLPTTIKEYVYNKLKDYEKIIVNNFYNKVDSSYNLIDQEIDNKNILQLVKILILKRRNVVWVDFGFNIQDEFGGKHPAIILKQTADSLFVVPLSSQEPDEQKDYHVKVEKVYNYEPIVRWANILRIKDISIHRIDFNSPIGDVKGFVLDDISQAISIAGIR